MPEHLNLASAPTMRRALHEAFADTAIADAEYRLDHPFEDDTTWQSGQDDYERLLWGRD